jgi:hypothetical protein
MVVSCLDAPKGCLLERRCRRFRDEGPSSCRGRSGPWSECDFSRASTIGFHQPVNARQEEIVSAAVIEFQESILDLDLRRDVASVKNVTDPHSILGQSPSDQETTVTIERIAL